MTLNKTTVSFNEFQVPKTVPIHAKRLSVGGGMFALHVVGSST